MARRYPTEGSQDFLKILDFAGYVEYEQFSGPHLGYFCGTCEKFSPDPPIEADPTRGECLGLDDAPVRTFGCCNNWALDEPDCLILANGDDPE